MIENIILKNIASYKEETCLSNLQRVNYFFGRNGSGKTTISRLLNKFDDYKDCKIEWKDNKALNVLVYNRDFVETHFSEKDTLKGIFTLGKDNVDLIKDIEEVTIKKNKCLEKIGNYTKTMNAKYLEIKEIDDEYANIFWENLSDYRANFSKCSRKSFGSKEKFKSQLINEAKKEILETVNFDINNLKSRYDEFFSNEQIEIPKVPLPDFTKILVYEKDKILQKHIVGKEDVNISELIKKLNNSSWVKHGIEYYKQSKDICPFCQQKISKKDFEKELNEYFDETFNTDVKLVDDLYDNYKNEAIKIESNLKNVNLNNLKLGDDIKDYIRQFHDIYDINLRRIENKKHELSQSISLDTLSNILEKIKNLIDDINKNIEKHNDTVKNLSKEQEKITQNFWSFLVKKEEKLIKQYNTKIEQLNNIIKNIKGKKQTEEDILKSINITLSNLNSKTTNVISVCENINKILTSFGFTSFKLDIADNNSYKLIRPDDNSNASQTLSEGEKNFLAFLYFYNLINGNFSKTKINDEKIVVIDDPISSLDNDTLFIISSLIRGIILSKDDIFKCVKQVFILTHNIYFYKEITFNPQRKNVPKYETFNIIKKNNGISQISQSPNDPIKTSYELLWNELKSRDTNNIYLPNCMRRILENYFKLIGRIRINNLEDEFEGPDKIICRSLISWIHDGSHSISEDLFYNMSDDNLIETYKRVFKEIFIKTGYESHYNMMMEIDEKE